MRNLVLSIIAIFMGISAQSRQIIDLHSHNILSEFKQFLDSKGASLEETFPLPDWDVESHIQFMDNAGIHTAVLSMPAPQPFYGDIEETKRVIRQYNEASAALKRKYPERFIFVAALPLPDVEAAIEEAVYALDSLEADGIKLATNSRGQYLGDAELDTLMSVLNDRKAVVLMHPHKPTPVNDHLIATTPLAMYEYPAETTRTVANMIARNVPARYSGIKWVVPHCGSFLPLAIPRMKAVLPAMIAKKKMQPIDWDANLENLYYDLAGGATPETVQSLLTITTPDHIMYGSDYPYQPATVLEKNLDNMRRWLSEDSELAPYSDDFLSNNALRLFGWSVEETTPKQLKHIEKEPMQSDGIVRLSKIEVDPEYLDEYMKFALEVGETSLKTEPGVLTMYPMADKDNPCNITILETYSSQDAYKKHIASPHFQKYKQGTLHMVKSLVLSDVTPLNPRNKLTNIVNE